MLSKISSMLDAVADSLEAKGFIKEAYEIDRVTNCVEKIAVDYAMIRAITPVREKIDTKNGVTFNINGDMVTVVRKPNGIFFCIEDENKQTSAGFLDTLEWDKAKNLSDKELAQMYWDNI